MTCASRTLTALSTLALCLLLPVTAAAQGNGHAYGHAKKSTPSGGGASQFRPSDPAGPAGTGIRNFGSWLDDASMMKPGEGTLTLSVSWFRSPLFREFDMPVVDGGIGLARRVQFGFSVPYYHVNEPGGAVTRGIGDLFLNAKVQLVEPVAGKRTFGLAVSPVLEMLSGEPGPGGRYHWGLPVSMEVQRGRVRGFGSVGYFSRGSVFASGAVQVPVSDRVALTGSVTRSHSLQDDELSATLGLTQTRTDVSASAGFALSPAASLFGAVGRTISRQDANAATVVISAGAAFTFEAWRPLRRPTR